MAAVLDPLVTYVQDMLVEKVKEEVGMMLGVPGEVEKLVVMLRDIKHYLADAERRRITDELVQEWVDEFKDTMYNASDILELCQLKSQDLRPFLEVDCCSPMVFCLRHPRFVHDIGGCIKELNENLDRINERRGRLKFMRLDAYEDRTHRALSFENRETTGLLSSGVVGEKLERDTIKMVRVLTKMEDESGPANENNIMVVSVMGAGGIGKTTLAQKIFNHESINGKFDKKIWLSVNQNFSMVELLRATIKQAGGDHGREKSMTILCDSLISVLTGEKFLLVMDDLWSSSAWEDVLKKPLEKAGARGSRVLITTRDENVSRDMKAVVQHHVEELGLEDAWSLLKTQVMVNELEEPEIETLRQVGMKLVERCGGLPLAIRVLGGLLCKKGRKKQDEWEKVLRNPAWSVDGMPRELNQALYLSYEDLPSHLKQCFLYHSLFSKTQPIGRDIIIEMWISEGFIRGKPNELEEIGKGYYKELILRNLIEPVPGCTDQTMCTMQDVVWSFAQYVAKEEALVSHNGDIGINKKMDSKKYRRVSIISAEVPESHQLEWSALQKQKKLRTLIIDGNIKVKPGNSLNSFSSLRTLRISSASIAPLVDSLCQLKHLRYLGLSGTDICLLPSNIYKMKFLQHIRLSRNESMVHIPANIAKLEQLTSFGLNKTKINGIPRGFRKLTNLRNIRGFPAHNDVGSKDWCSLEELGPLSQLTSLEINDLENVSSGHFSGRAKLESKVSLTDLELRCASNVGQDGLVMKHASQEEQQRIGEVFDNLKPPRSLVTLSIDGYFGGQLPSWLSTSSLKSLTTLFLENLSCCTQLPNGLCELPLQFLQILRAPAIECVSTEFLISQHQSQVPIAFPRLSKLLLIGLVEWKKWDWQEQVRALTVLKELQIKRCKLNYLPPGLSLHAKALEVLSIKGVEHLNYLGNLPSLVNLEVELTLELERIVNLHSLEKLSIIHCPRLKVLVDMPVLSSFELKDYGMRTLPGYLRDVKPKHLRIDCSMQLLNLIAMGARGPEWNKFSHIDQVKAYDEERMFYVFYNSSAGNKIQTNITRSSTYRV